MEHGDIRKVQDRLLLLWLSLKGSEAMRQFDDMAASLSRQQMCAA
jgi:hypothetical protein|tara:strand:- start:362 stop:496 length:135 start_codon:yes stop_codon:yes gene_type:complete